MLDSGSVWPQRMLHPPAHRSFPPLLSLHFTKAGMGDASVELNRIFFQAQRGLLSLLDKVMTLQHDHGCPHLDSRAESVHQALRQLA